MKPLRYSALKHIATSPRHYKHALTVERDTASMRVGRLVHSKLMGCSPDESKPIAVFSGASRRGKAWEEFRAGNVGHDIFLASENEKANAMVESVRSDALAYDIIGPHRLGNREMTLRWKFAGRECQGTPDFFSGDVLVDVKSTRCAAPARWAGRFGEARKLGYVCQLAWYADAIVACGYPKPERVCIVAVENVAPFDVVVYDLDESELEIGRRIYRGWLETLLSCEASDSWPGYSQCAVRLVSSDDDEAPALVWGDEDETEEAA